MINHKWQNMTYGSWDVESNRQIFSQFGPFFVLLLKNQFFLKKKVWKYHQLTLVNHRWQSYDVWFLRYKVQLAEFFVYFFLPFWCPLKTWKIKILIKLKKHFRLYHYRYYRLHRKCINENHMVYGSWDMECDRLNFQPEKSQLW